MSSKNYSEDVFQPSYVEYGVFWTYPDGDTMYHAYGVDEVDKNKALKAPEDFPDRVGSYAVQRTVTFSKWQRIQG